MTISTYSELKDGIANWSARYDLGTSGANVARVDEIIDNAEAMLNRDLRAVDMETKNATFSITGEYVAVPTDFLESRSLYLNTSPKRTVVFLPNDAQTDMYGSGSGAPRFYCVDGGTFRFAPTPDGIYSATLMYYAKVPALNGLQTTNWLLTSHPDLYLAACMIWAATFYKDQEMIGFWRDAYRTLLEALQSAANRARWGGNSMAVRVA